MPFFESVKKKNPQKTKQTLAYLFHTSHLSLKHWVHFTGAKVSFFDLLSEKCACLQSICVNMKCHKLSPENQDETLLHEGEGGTLWFRKETTRKEVIHIA